MPDPRPILSTPSLVHEITTWTQPRPGWWEVRCACGRSWSGPRARVHANHHLALMRKRLRDIAQGKAVL